MYNSTATDLFRSKMFICVKYSVERIKDSEQKSNGVKFALVTLSYLGIIVPLSLSMRYTLPCIKETEPSFYLTWKGAIFSNLMPA